MIPSYKEKQTQEKQWTPYMLDILNKEMTVIKTFNSKFSDRILIMALADVLIYLGSNYNEFKKKV